MKKLVVILSVLAVFVLGSAAFAADAPKGCSGCHTGKYSLANDVKNVKGHPTLGADATYDTCLKCHRAGTKLDLPPILHKAHYAKGKDSHFVSNFGGLCQNCHIVDVTTGDFKSVQK